MASRLERLWILLDQGSTPVLRKTAAEQIGDIIASQPGELEHLINTVIKYLRSRSWQTRIAAGQAVEAIARNVKPWNPPKQSNEAECVNCSSSGKLQVHELDLGHIVSHGEHLLASSGQEYMALDAELTHMTGEEKKMFYQKQFREKLGLSGAAKIDTGLETFIEDSDLIPDNSSQSQMKPEVGQTFDIGSLKRPASVSVKQEVVSSEPPSKRPKECESEGTTQEKSEGCTIKVKESTWPFTGFCEQLFIDLMDPRWEYRHGAATALRGVIKVHGTTAGYCSSCSLDKRDQCNEEWLEDAAVRLIIVLALDRFADYIGDEVVAPVRSTCSQVLGSVLGLLPFEKVVKISHLLHFLAHQKQWEIQFSSLLAIQHLLAVRQEDAETLLPVLTPAILVGLQEGGDDVKGAAASALLPVSKCFSMHLPKECQFVMNLLWQALHHLDDLCAATGSILELLAQLLATSKCHFKDELMELTPRLFPFMSHGIKNVRRSCFVALVTLLNKNGDFIMSQIPSRHDYCPTLVLENEGALEPWLIAHQETLLCLIYFMTAFEMDEKLRDILFVLWVLVARAAKLAICQYWMVHWLELASYPMGMHARGSVLVQKLSEVNLVSSSKPLDTEGAADGRGRMPLPCILGGLDGSELSEERETATLTARIDCARLIGFLMARCSQQGQSEELRSFLNTTNQLLCQMLQSKIANQRILACLTVYFWSLYGKMTEEEEKDLLPLIYQILSQQPLYDEVIPVFVSLQNDCQLLNNFVVKKGGSTFLDSSESSSTFNVEFATKLVTSLNDNTISKLKLDPKDVEEVKILKQNVITGIGQVKENSKVTCDRVSVCAAGILLTMNKVIDKLNPIIRPVMDVLKSERNPAFQALVASWLAKLLSVCRSRHPSPNPKVIKNLSLLSSCNACAIPGLKESFTAPSNVGKMAASDPKAMDITCTWRSGILALLDFPAVPIGSGSAGFSVAVGDSQRLKSLEVAKVQFNGVHQVLRSCVRIFEASLFSELPWLWDQISENIDLLNTKYINFSEFPSNSASDIHSCLCSMEMLEVLCSYVQDGEKLFGLLTQLGTLLSHPLTVVRHMAARCLAALVQIDVPEVMEFLSLQVLPKASDVKTELRQGITELIYILVMYYSNYVSSFAILLVMPTLGRMTDQDEHTRLLASLCFAQLVPLAAIMNKSEHSLPSEFQDRIAESRLFLDQLLHPNSICSYDIPIKINADLRKYQKDGVNWLAFLNKYNLHGILCDDMGLGKTLQSICIMAGDHFDLVKQKGTKLPPSIVICPPTLTGHWCHEVAKFCSEVDLYVLHYIGTPVERLQLQSEVSKCNLVVASYDVVRNDIAFFRAIMWHYCVLDEGHVIKNPKAKITKAVKDLKCRHRLILTGTPIQNNVLDLWSLFDFLMPGFLGTQRQFHDRFGRAILSSRDAKSSSKEQEAGALAMESLHKQILPFMLRRMKDDVLQDLPPKIIQDYFCELSPLQVKLYEQLAKDLQKDNNPIQGENTEDISNVPHVFQALQYLKKVCNHPKLVLDKMEKEAKKKLLQSLGDETSTGSINHSAKLMALKQLLVDCGFNSSAEVDDNIANTAAVSQHRALVFCQLKSMIDILENDLLKKHLPGISYLRLDGSTPVQQRQGIVQRFNEDASIDLLLLTTHVGGLGLSLTGADTVIFIEHDWNPTKDLQAMDRCHRLGQKKVVNVYRLITRGTLEEKIMSLQKFKMNIANTVVSQENASFASMDTSGIFDLFSLENTSPDKKSVSKRGNSSSLQEMLKNLSDTNIWSESDYQSEYDISSYMDKFSK